MMVASADVAGWDLDGVWADDFHHVIRRMLGGDTHGYFVDYEGTAEELAAILRRGWLYVGQMSARHRAPRGTDPSHVPMRASIVCVQNHDQIGNRAFGDRLHHSADAAAWRAAITLLLTVPMTPLLFMGQEWAASTPFQFFTDFGPSRPAGQRGTQARVSKLPGVCRPEHGGTAPRPAIGCDVCSQQVALDEQTEPEHAASLALHRTLLQLQRPHPALQASDATLGDARALDRDTVLVTQQDPDGSSVYVICARLRGSGTVACDLERSVGWRTLLTTEDSLFATDSRPPTLDLGNGSITFQRPGAIIVERALQGAS